MEIDTSIVIIGKKGVLNKYIQFLIVVDSRFSIIVDSQEYESILRRVPPDNPCIKV